MCTRNVEKEIQRPNGSEILDLDLYMQVLIVSLLQANVKFTVVR